MSEQIDYQIAELADTLQGDLVAAVANYVSTCNERQFELLRIVFLGVTKQTPGAGLEPQQGLAVGVLSALAEAGGPTMDADYYRRFAKNLAADDFKPNPGVSNACVAALRAAIEIVWAYEEDNEAPSPCEVEA